MECPVFTMMLRYGHSIGICIILCKPSARFFERIPIVLDRFTLKNFFKCKSIKFATIFLKLVYIIPVFKGKGARILKKDRAFPKNCYEMELISSWRSGLHTRDTLWKQEIIEVSLPGADFCVRHAGRNMVFLAFRGEECYYLGYVWMGIGRRTKDLRRKRR